jgi:hypothetical protein
MLLIAALLLSLAAAGGAGLAAMHLKARSPPLVAGLGHASLALAGIGVLAAAAVAEGDNLRANSALLCFALALVGGGFLALFRFEGDAAPGFMIALHALAAIAGLLLVWLAVAAA